jgi:hypothetical protein
MVGERGTGKTKTLIENVNKASSASNGQVVCLEWGDKLRFDVSCHVRLIDAEEYGISTAEKLYGFLTGILASNYDVTDLFIDSALKMCEDQKALALVLEKVAPMLESHNVNTFVTASLPADKLIPELSGYTK